MAGGGTGGHVVPAIAVAQELRKLGHEAVFVGTRNGLEATLVPKAGFPIRWIRAGGLQRMGLIRQIRALAQIPGSVLRSWFVLRETRAAAVFSLGGYVAAPVMLAGAMGGRPLIVMEPNAMPGLVSRRLGRRAWKVLVSFPETTHYFPPGRCELTGLPVREEFFALTARPPRDPFTVLITGGSRGARALNAAARASWPLFRKAGGFRVLLQCGTAEHQALAGDFAASGLAGAVVPFIDSMPAAYDEADLIVSRAGAGAASELAAAGKPSILVPFPFAADDHQLHNAQAMERAGAAICLPENELNGERLFELVRDLRSDPVRLLAMGQNARKLARPGAAARAADLLVSCGAIDTPAQPPKQ